MFGIGIIKRRVERGKAREAAIVARSIAYSRRLETAWAKAASYPPLKVSGNPPRLARVYPWWVILIRAEVLDRKELAGTLTIEEAREKKAVESVERQIISDQGDVPTFYLRRHSDKLFVKFVGHCGAP